MFAKFIPSALIFFALTQGAIATVFTRMPDISAVYTSDSSGATNEFCCYTRGSICLAKGSLCPIIGCLFPGPGNSGGSGERGSKRNGTGAGMEKKYKFLRS
ncbi:hypothetical protein K438DRAFT_1757986 [Mycena galopus ATCC 62051]|nr:hypothetical protein K438DRAFT_1757986 [Mycena galopus ATCC 62051]